MKENNLQPRLLYPARISFKYEGEIKSFTDKQSNHSFIWVYKWWGVIPVFITTYVPFFLASNYVPDMAPGKRNAFLITEWALVAVLLAVLIPLGII